MFMTLKPSKGNKGKVVASGMQQLTSTEAGEGGLEKRFGANRRASCLHCQTKRVRCSGSRTCCDRCKKHGTECVLPSQSRPDRRKRVHTSDTNAQEESIYSVNNIMEGSSIEKHPPRVPNVPVSPASPADNDVFANEPMDQDSAMEYHPFDRIPATDSPSTGMGLGTPVSQSSTRDAPQMRDPGDAQIETEANNAPSSIPPCVCLYDLVDIVQKLDDDEFRIRSLSFDQVFKLQKYLIFHCLAPLDCKSCSDSSRTHTVVLIITGRVVEMFLCLSRRLKNTQPQFIQESQNVNADSTGQDRGRPSFFRFKAPPSVPPGWGPTNIYDGETGEPGIAVVCNPDMFSPDFREQYSTEEQFHMIKVLAKIQIRNLNTLLVRVGAMPQSQRSRARMGKIEEQKQRLEDAADSMEESFGAILREIERIESHS